MALRWLIPVCIVAATAFRADTPPTAEQLAAFQSDVLPILKERCFKCHGGEKVKGGLRLSGRDAILKGGDTGPAVSLDKPDNSLLLQAIGYAAELQMPPTGKLPQKEIDILTRWVKDGLPGMPATDVAKPIAHGKSKSDGKDYWAYQPVKRPEIPAVKNAAWVRTPIDAFVLAKLEAKGLQPNPPADAVALIRRMTYDLIGLPPTPEEVDAFCQSAIRNPQSAIEQLVDRLLASPHYGEKWGRHWLDVVRYAETNGYERDGAKPFVWRYRDYVIRSFNADKPYDRFIKEQLAGDELTDGGIDGIIATGFYRLGLWDDEPADPEQAIFDGYDDIATTTSQAFLAMTVNCCRCHDHKADPIPQTDYYRLVAFFRDIRPYSNTRDLASRFNLSDISPPEVRAAHEANKAEFQKMEEDLIKKKTAIENEAIKKMPAEDQHKAEGPERREVIKKVPEFLDEKGEERYSRSIALIEKIRDARRGQTQPDLALSVNSCDPNPPVTHVLIRGNPHSPGAAVVPGFPSALRTPDPSPPVPSEKTSGRRSQLAEWIANPKNPLTARVMANRIWHFHFGRGIVSSPNDFGKFGVLPTHPELLDWLADQFMHSGWSVKSIHRTILMSNTYRMSAAANEASLKADPENQLFWRVPMRRLSAEEVRDSILAVSGKLNLPMFGPSVYPPIPREVLAGQSRPGEGWFTSAPDQANRRSVYVHIKRSLQLPILATHDQADTDSSCPVRYTTTVPTQALGMLNGQFMQEQAAGLAARLQREHPNDLAGQVRRAIRLTTGRLAGDEEVKRDLDFMAALEREQKMTEEKALEQYCLLVLNANEFVYLD